MTALRLACVLSLVSATAAADPRPPSIVDVFNRVDAAHALKKTNGAWMVNGKLAATVDSANGYLAFTDPVTKQTTSAAIWKATNGRWFLGVSDGQTGLSWWEVDGAGDTPEECQPPPTPEITVDALLMPGADARLAAANAKVLGDILPRFELPRHGTTLIARIELDELRVKVAAATLAPDVKQKLRALVDTQLYTRLELTYRKDGKFEVGDKSK